MFIAMLSFLSCRPLTAVEGVTLLRWGGGGGGGAGGGSETREFHGSYTFSLLQASGKRGLFAIGAWKMYPFAVCFARRQSKVLPFTSFWVFGT